jgi:DNA polymerase-3 subunit alpha
MQNLDKSHYIHLRCHSEFSITDGIVKIEDYVKQAVDKNMPAVAITDLSNLFGAVKFYKKATEEGLKPLIGCELWLENEINRDEPYRILTLCKDKEGYENLSQLLSKAYLENQYRERAEIKKSWLLTEFNKGLIVLSGATSGDIGQLMLNEKFDEAKEALSQWKNYFGDRFYIELQRHGEGDLKVKQEQYIKQVLHYAVDYEVPVVATHPIQFMKEDDFRAHESKSCIAEGFVLGDRRRPKLFTSNQYCKDEAEMTELFSDIPSALANSVSIAGRCNFSFILGKNYLPNFPIPDDTKIEDYLLNEAKNGLEKRIKVLFLDKTLQLKKRIEYEERLNFEVGVINEMGYAGYFLIVADFINWAKNNNIPVGPGRGSGAGSVVAYSLGITDLDPIKYNLLFERFLNPDRVSMPDFDIDFCMEGRDKVIDYVKQKYGSSSVSQIATFGTMAARAAIGDVGRVLQLPFNFVQEIAKLIPTELGITLQAAVDQEPRIKERIAKEEEVKELFDLAMRLEGLVRNVSMHAGGVLIAPTRISAFSPIYCQPDGGGIISQFDKYDVESVGLVKFDFLGLRTLTIIDMALKNANRILEGKSLSPLNLDEIAIDDRATFNLLKESNTTAVFQLESSGMKDMLKQAKPDCFEDIVALVALYRPGPMDLIPEFCKRKLGQQKVTYPHPATESILKETYGIAVYQEQVMQIAQAVAGYSLGSADLLRRAMGKKNKEEMDAQRTDFIAGATKNNLDEKQANALFDLLEKFAGYGFNKSHAAAYAKIAYQTAYLKAHFAASFLAASMSAEMNNTDNIHLLFDDCKINNLELLPPDINQSSYKFIPLNDKQIIYGLGAIKGTGDSSIQLILEERENNGFFKSLFDFTSRLDLTKVNRRVVESLVRSGAFDKIESNRASLLASVSLAIKMAEQNKNEAGQEGLFGGSDIEAITLIEMNPWEEKNQLLEEKAALGFYFSGHLFSYYKKIIKSFISTKLIDLRPRKENYLIAGIISSVKYRQSSRGKIAIITIDDGEANIDAVLGNNLLTQSYNLIKDDELIIIEGRVSLDDYSGSNRLSAIKIYDLMTFQSLKANLLKISLNHQSDSFKLKELLKPYCDLETTHKKCKVKIDYQNNHGHVELILGSEWEVSLHEDLIIGLTESFNDDNVKILYN